ncbi:PspA/IM30 family protein [Phosphitispora sp. TUW77]|uniref:PspA/IM30 family protein n=1 Tax=Phosphitispora sp. TUW77 TaxID=3152361 RepID=UPI003AB823D6
MGLFKRISDNIRANLNAMVDKAEDPVKLLDQYLRDMEDDIADAEAAVARQLAVVRKFQAQYEDAGAMAARREAQAIEALEKDREDLARKALLDKKLHMAKAGDYKIQFDNSGAAAETLKSQLREMKDEYEKLRAKRDTLLARAQAAKARKEIHGAMGGFAKDNARRGFERMEEKVMQLEAEADVASEMRGSSRSLDVELEALGSDREIDTELALLKEKLRVREADQK